VVAYGTVVTGGLGVGVVKLTDSVRGCSNRAGRGTGAAGAHCPAGENEQRLGGRGAEILRLHPVVKSE
jgi:hypothetical protein